MKRAAGVWERMVVWVVVWYSVGFSTSGRLLAWSLCRVRGEWIAGVGVVGSWRLEYSRGQFRS